MLDTPLVNLACVRSNTLRASFITTTLDSSRVLTRQYNYLYNKIYSPMRTFFEGYYFLLYDTKTYLPIVRLVLYLLWKQCGTVSLSSPLLSLKRAELIAKQNVSQVHYIKVGRRPLDGTRCTLFSVHRNQIFVM